jgi:hypothetical protein
MDSYFNVNALLLLIWLFLLLFIPSTDYQYEYDADDKGDLTALIYIDGDDLIKVKSWSTKKTQWIRVVYQLTSVFLYMYTVFIYQISIKIQNSVAFSRAPRALWDSLVLAADAVAGGLSSDLKSSRSMSFRRSSASPSIENDENCFK